MSLGLPSYSPAWTKIPKGTYNGLFSTATDDKWVGWSTFSDKDKSLEPQGIISWWNLKEEKDKSENGFKLYSTDCPADEGVVVPMKHIYSESKQAMACYDDEEVTKKKSEWARKKGMGGIFFWDAQQDKNGDLLRAAREGWGKEEEEEEEEELISLV